MTDTPSLAGTALVRGLMFAALWLVLMPSAKPVDLAFGVFSSVAATWTSLHLLPREAGHLRLRALLAFVPHFLWQSVLAGVDVARRALDPRMPMRPGFVSCPVGFPPGLARNEFASIMSLLPGSVPVGETEASIIYHCVDVSEPLAQHMAEEEQLLRAALVVGQAHD